MTALSRHASAFELRIEPDRAMRGATALVAALGAAALLAALNSHSRVADAAWLPASAWWGLTLLGPPLAAGLGWRLARHAPLRLRWDGRAWWLRSPEGAADERPLRLTVAIDLGTWLLLRLHAARGPLWPPRYLALARAAHPAAWPGLRATLFTAPQRGADDDDV
ncbi:hypothetical protein G8A07_07310 [Roseateles sp. DAIF2]|uniref:hypothetical protein n=1 Tax=Roseateles sp. DAIF2 TaxID=2714952 RepID=UPI0018A2E10F|nr:hypothetical protein [Roseateles sp. DAIF2]QPF72759.1 hypothetical protein G8A07_07310 [Roseateles sp. DAIF2]